MYPNCGPPAERGLRSAKIHAMREHYRTLGGPGRKEIERVLGSRFIATAAPLHGPEEVEALLAPIRREFHAARHHCYAWRTGIGGERFRAHDGGEPGGSAGRPILERIDALELTGVIVVVTRYFGGTKLGVGGLARAYARAAEAVLAECPIRTLAITQRFQVEHDYELTHAVQGLIGALALPPASAEYGSIVRLVFDVPIGRVDLFERELRERTAGRATLSELAPAGDG